MEAFPSLMMPVVLLGGIYGGVVTPTEAAAVAAAYALLISVVLYRSVSFLDLYLSVLSSARTTASQVMRGSSRSGVGFSTGKFFRRASKTTMIICDSD